MLVSRLNAFADRLAVTMSSAALVVAFGFVGPAAGAGSPTAAARSIEISGSQNTFAAAQPAAACKRPSYVNYFMPAARAMMKRSKVSTGQVETLIASKGTRVKSTAECRWHVSNGKIWAVISSFATVWQAGRIG
jgi:hypothetical protein